MSSPRVSILIPNFNNGAASSSDGCRNFIEELLQSILKTLETDPTPLEVIVADDGSTDDSLATCRAWAARTWRGGAPFFRLLEFEHRGVLAAVANDLTRAAAGEIICRLDGDIICRTPHWAQLICQAFDQMPKDVGIIGPKQLGLDGTIQAAGTFIFHPCGRCNVAQGAPPASFRQPLEVDDVMGCFYCHRRRVWDDVGGYDEALLRGQTEDFSLAARLKGWRVFAIPEVEFVHAHAARLRRETRADSLAGIEQSLDSFQAKWGFDRLAPDLDEVSRRFEGTKLLWNTPVFAALKRREFATRGSVSLPESEWPGFVHDAKLRDSIVARVQAVRDMDRTIGPCGRTVHVMSRGGLLCHLLAQAGLNCTGIDPDERWVALAKSLTQRYEYPGTPPHFVAAPDVDRWPLAQHAFDTALLIDVLELHPNPQALLREAHRVLRPGGLLALVVRTRLEPLGIPREGPHPYRPHELVVQVQGSRLFEPLAAEGIAPVPGSMVLMARRRELHDRSFYPQRAIQASMAGCAAAQ